MSRTTSIVLAVVFSVLSLGTIVFYFFWQGFDDNVGENGKKYFSFDKRKAINALKAFGVHWLLSLVSLAILLISGSLIYLINPTGYAPSKLGATFLFAFLTFSSFYLIKPLFSSQDPESYLVAQIFLDLFFSLLTCTLDLAPMVSILILIFDVLVFIPKRWLALDGFFTLFALIPRCFVFGIMIGMFGRYTGLMEGIISEFIVPILLWVFFLLTNLSTLFLAERYFSNPKKWEMIVHGSVILLCLIIAFSLPYPYSKSYAYRGYMTHVFYNNGTSVFGFGPHGGSRNIGYLLGSIQLDLLVKIRICMLI